MKPFTDEQTDDLAAMGLLMSITLLEACRIGMEQGPTEMAEVMKRAFRMGEAVSKLLDDAVSDDPGKDKALAVEAVARCESFRERYGFREGKQ